MPWCLQGPQYVVPAFSVFVCSSCSGVHRQFGHRVKGISLCTFTSEEIESLKSGGNDVRVKDRTFTSVRMNLSTSCHCLNTAILSQMICRYS
jgi:hypothetical protein